jgi:hypothetical protein
VFITHSGHGVGSGYREPNFRFGAPMRKIIYLPLTTLDQRFRPDYWNNYSSLDHVRGTRDYPWGHIEVVDGYEKSLSMYPYTNKDVDDAISVLRDSHRITFVRVKGDHFGDTHLHTLQDIREFDSVELLATGVTRAAVEEFRKSNPNTSVTCISVTENGSVLY